MSKLEDFPHLQEYFVTYRQKNGIPEHDNCFPNLLIWFREVIDNDDELAMNLLQMDEDEVEEFCSWGHNSRWLHVGANAFASLMECNPEYMKNTLIQLAEYYGDPDIEAKYFSKKDKK